MKVAEIILNQLGGNKFIAMTGSNNFVSSDKSLTMSLRTNKAKAKYLIITLTNKDEYNMTFASLNKKLNMFVKFEHKGVQVHMLRDIFTKVTGLDTSL